MPRQPRTLYIAGITPRVTARELAYEFERFGNLIRCDIPSHRNFNSIPYAFVEYVNPKDAQYALYKMNGRKFDGQYLNIQWARNEPSKSWRYDQRYNVNKSTKIHNRVFYHERKSLSPPIFSRHRTKSQSPIPVSYIDDKKSHYPLLSSRSRYNRNRSQSPRPYSHSKNVDYYIHQRERGRQYSRSRERYSYSYSRSRSKSPYSRYYSKRVRSTSSSYMRHNSHSNMEDGPNSKYNDYPPLKQNNSPNLNSNDSKSLNENEPLSNHKYDYKNDEIEYNNNYIRNSNNVNNENKYIKEKENKMINNYKKENTNINTLNKLKSLDSSDIYTNENNLPNHQKILNDKTNNKNNNSNNIYYSSLK